MPDLLQLGAGAGGFKYYVWEKTGLAEYGIDALIDGRFLVHQGKGLVTDFVYGKLRIGTDAAGNGFFAGRVIGRKSQNQFFCTDGNVVVIGALAVPKGNKAHIDFAAGNQLLLSADICFNYVNDNIRILAVKKRINAGFNVAADAWNFERVPGVCRFPVSQGQNTFCPLHHENLINKS